MALDFPQDSQHIFTDQRLTCTNSVESRFYKNDFGFIPCQKCGCNLGPDGITKFNSLKKDYSTVIPCCNGVCAVGPAKGWRTSGKSKKKLRSVKRKAVSMNIDLHKFRPRPIGGTVASLRNWLADSRPAWNQLIATMRIKRQIKKHKSARGV